MSAADQPTITCDGCGACCMEMGSPPFIPGDGELEKLPTAVREDYDRGRVVRELPGAANDVPCFWLDDNHCRHYEHRPEVCRVFVLGGGPCYQWCAQFHIYSEVKADG